MKKNILLTCAGGYGALNFIENNFKNNRKIEFLGTHSNKFFLLRSAFKKNYHVSSATNELTYIKDTMKIIKDNKIDLIIPKSDIEVKIIGKHRDKIGCKVFLPDQKDIENVQDKYSFYKILLNSNIPIAKTFRVNKISEISKLIKKLPKVKNRYWLRIKTEGTAGAYGASWVQNSIEAINWIKRCTRQKNIKVSDFIISEYLPGRLFETLLLYKDGFCLFGKVYENNSFLMGGTAGNFGVGSSPEIASSVNDKLSKLAIKNSKKAVDHISSKLNTIPNGIYHMSVKVNKNKMPCLTEINIGRTPSTINIFNNVGKINASREFINCALGNKVSLKNFLLDVDHKKKLIIRSFDCLPKIVNIKQ